MYGIPMSARQASVERNTNETRIKVSVNLDGSGKFTIKSGLPFLEHMLEQVARHGLIDMDIVAEGDLHIDAHHTVEDLGITLGQAVEKALNKTGIRRYGHAYVPLDEALSRVVIDFSGRPGLEFHVPFKRGSVGDFDVDLFHEFFQIETVFKAFGRAVRMAIEPDPRMQGTVPSTKGTLSG